jgi:hypothetical protein
MGVVFCWFVVGNTFVLLLLWRTQRERYRSRVICAKPFVRGRRAKGACLRTSLCLFSLEVCCFCCLLLLMTSEGYEGLLLFGYSVMTLEREEGSPGFFRLFSSLLHYAPPLALVWLKSIRLADFCCGKLCIAQIRSTQQGCDYVLFICTWQYNCWCLSDMLWFFCPPLSFLPMR